MNGIKYEIYNVISVIYQAIACPSSCYASQSHAYILPRAKCHGGISTSHLLPLCRRKLRNKSSLFATQTLECSFAHSRGANEHPELLLLMRDLNEAPEFPLFLKDLNEAPEFPLFLKDLNEHPEFPLLLKDLNEHSEFPLLLNDFNEHSEFPLLLKDL